MPSQIRQNGAAISAFREKDKVDVAGLARAAGLSYSSLDNIEHERKSASEETLARIAEALFVPPAAIARAAGKTRHNGATIRHLRIKSGLKPGEFANEALISYPHLDNLENERKQASLEILHRIARALDVPVRCLLRDSASTAQGGEAA